MTTPEQKPENARDYSMFDAEISGAVLNLSLLRRLLRWLKPYRVTFGISAILVILASTLQPTCVEKLPVPVNCTCNDQSGTIAALRNGPGRGPLRE